jgi:hypothetical protein
VPETEQTTEATKPLSPCVIIPTFWARRRGRFTDRLINVYDHPTPVDEDGTLPACLDSLAKIDGLGRVIVIVAAADASVEHEAEDRVHSILAARPGIDSLVFGPAELGSLHRRLEQLEFSDMVPGVSLTGYGAVRNVGLIVAATLGCESVVFVDDDEVVTEADFLSRAVEPVLAKTGYYVDDAGSVRVPDDGHWADAFWRVAAQFNRSADLISKAPRLKPSNVAYGGCLALHRDMYANVSFDPWVLRGEDIDYVINARMHGADVYRFIYEHRKLEFAKSQVDLRQVSPASLRPYPGELVASGVAWRAFMTAVLHAVTGKETGAFLEVARAAMTDAARYARRNCDNYYAFQRRWPIMMERVWEDVALGSLFSGERSVDRTAITGRFPVVPSP